MADGRAVDEVKRERARTGVAARRLRASERRGQLLEIAGRLFSIAGFHGVSMEQLAASAGVTKPVLYQHFPSKRELYLGLVHDAVAEMETTLRRALEGTPDNRARVEGAIAAYFDFVEDDRFRLLFDTAKLPDTDVRGAVESAMARVAETVGTLVAEEARLSAQAASFLASALRGLATEGARWWLEHPEVEKGEAVRLLARLAWGGLGCFGAEDHGARPA